VQVIFSINLHGRDLQILNKIKAYFGVGNININKKTGEVNYLVRSIKDISSVIIPHFNQYKLLTKKKADFELFSRIVKLVVQNQHLTIEGLNKICELRACLNLGFKGELAKKYPLDINKRPVVEIAKYIEKD
jgi:hypothetical protein